MIGETEGQHVVHVSLPKPLQGESQLEPASRDCSAVLDPGSEGLVHVELRICADVREVFEGTRFDPVLNRVLIGLLVLLIATMTGDAHNAFGHPRSVSETPWTSMTTNHKLTNVLLSTT